MVVAAKAILDIRFNLRSKRRAKLNIKTTSPKNKGMV